MVKKRNIKKEKRLKKRVSATRMKKKIRRRKPLQRRGIGSIKRGMEKKRSSSAIKLMRSEDNPIIAPRVENDWEAWQTFNPGVILLNGKVHFLYRAIGKDGISRLGYAASQDGFHIDERLPFPVYEHRLNIRVKKSK